MALRSFHEVFESDRRGLIKTISLEVGTDTIDPATGQRTDISFVIAAADRDLFMTFDLSAVVPELTLSRLGAAVSKNPFGLVPAERSGDPTRVKPKGIQFNPPPGWPKPQVAGSRLKGGHRIRLGRPHLPGGSFG